jgi:hypothetical protein
MAPGLLENVRVYTLTILGSDSSPKGSTVNFIDVGKTFIVNRRG